MSVLHIVIGISIACCACAKRYPPALKSHDIWVCSQCEQEVIGCRYLCVFTWLSFDMLKCWMLKGSSSVSKCTSNEFFSYCSWTELRIVWKCFSAVEVFIALAFSYNRATFKAFKCLRCDNFPKIFKFCNSVNFLSDGFSKWFWKFVSIELTIDYSGKSLENLPSNSGDVSVFFLKQMDTFLPNEISKNKQQWMKLFF